MFFNTVFSLLLVVVALVLVSFNCWMAQMFMDFWGLDVAGVNLLT